MLAALRHRGPDGIGTYQDETISLGITRLAILDPEPLTLPFRSPCGQITAICNGEIYNWQELRRTLTAQGHQFHTQCDCEVLPAAWLAWGTELPRHLNGMFALAIHDAREGSLFLARDRCGQKPLYLTTQGPLRFSSEIKSLAQAGVDLTLAPEHLQSWLSLRYLPEPTTLFAHIETLPAAHSLYVEKNGKRTLTRYWEPPLIPQPEEHPQALEELDRLTRSSVELALQADVPLSVYLSAGVDSSLLAYYAKELGAEFTSTSLSFAAASDEGPEAAIFAQSLGITHHATTLTPESLTELPRVIAQMDRPIGDALILAFDHLAQHTRSLGSKVALGGEGPDEYFAGYSFQKALLTAQRLGPVGRNVAAATLRLLPSQVLNRLAQFPAKLGSSGQQKAASYFREFSRKTPFQRATDLHTLFTPNEMRELLAPDLLSQQTPLSQFEHSLSEDDFLNALGLQYRHWLPDWSLIRQDKNTMAHGLEYRAPFLDHRLIDFASQLPTSSKIHHGQEKYLWRKLAARHLPKAVTHRPKQPFYLPLEHPNWRKPFLALARERLSRQTLAQHGWLNEQAIEPLFQATQFLPLKKLAAILILQLWIEQHTSSP